MTSTRAFGLHADDNAVGAHEIVDGRTFAQEFRVRGHVELGLGVGLGDGLLDLAVGADRNCGFGDDHGIARQRARDLFGGGHHIGQVRMPIAATCRRAHGDEDRIRIRHRTGQVGGEGQAPGLHVLGHQQIEPRLVDRNLARVEHLDLAGVLVDADHVMAEIRKTNPGYKADIARPNHRNLHK
jgi:hypothetical protein